MICFRSIVWLEPHWTLRNQIIMDMNGWYFWYYNWRFGFTDLLLKGLNRYRCMSGVNALLFPQTSFFLFFFTLGILKTTGPKIENLVSHFKEWCIETLRTWIITFMSLMAGRIDPSPPLTHATTCIRQQQLPAISFTRRLTIMPHTFPIQMSLIP